MKSVVIEDDNEESSNIQPGFITLKIRVQTEIYTNITDIKIDPQIPFDIFCNKVKENIFSQIFEKQFLDSIKFLKKNQEISKHEKRNLEQLGFQNNDILDVRLQLKGGRIN
ncbi:unnamed protein product [Paramecium sonneborni]|uniref:Uncharacterized protein n=1 Tax=Paramecium sonneborni TaxID=65129 RepID=A0A8S1JY99_9CILI|nr:unnamed protein product [Paramecium sonneborni]